MAKRATPKAATTAVATPPVTVEVPGIRPPNPFYSGPPPQMQNGMTFREVGQSGLRAFAGWVREEFLPELQGRQGARTYREMSDNSPIIGAILYSIGSAMQKVTWRTNAVDDTPAAQEAADFADSLRMDMDEPWEDVITEANSMLTYGYAPLEINYKRRLGKDPGADPTRPGKKLPKSKFDDGLVGWKSMPLRGQDTVLKWFLGPNGEIEGMTQQPWVGPLIDIPIEKMLLFRPQHMKGNPEGRSILRTAYRSYYLTKRIEEQESILFERLNGIPVIKVPQQLMEAALTDSNARIALEAFKNIAVNLRIDEQMGVVLPSDTFNGPTGPSAVPQYSLELVAPGGGRATVTPTETLTRHATNMLASVMADFIMLGHGAHGTQALSVSKVDMFFQAIEGFLNTEAGIFNRHALTRAWDLNGMDPDLMPEFEPDLAQRVDLDVLSNYVLRLAQSGMAVFPNKDIESALLDAGGLPDIQDPDALDAAAAAQDEQEPVAIVGPLAAQATQQLAPPPPPIMGAPPGTKGAKPGEPADTAFGKMVKASLARRIIKLQGPSTPIGRGKLAKARRRKQPLPSSTEPRLL